MNWCRRDFVCRLFRYSKPCPEPPEVEFWVPELWFWLLCPCLDQESVPGVQLSLRSWRGRDGPASYFSLVLDGGGVDVSILPLEQDRDSGSRQLVFVLWLISDFFLLKLLGNGANELASGELTMNWSLRIDFFSVSFSEPVKDVVWHQDYA